MSLRLNVLFGVTMTTRMRRGLFFPIRTTALNHPPLSGRIMNFGSRSVPCMQFSVFCGPLAARLLAGILLIYISSINALTVLALWALIWSSILHLPSDFFWSFFVLTVNTRSGTGRSHALRANIAPLIAAHRVRAVNSKPINPINIISDSMTDYTQHSWVLACV